MVRTNLPNIDMSRLFITFDTSPWGGGAVLHMDGKPTEFLMVSWSRGLAAELSVKVGTSSSQTTWEYLTLFLSLAVWGARFSSTGIGILGDNIGALADALSLKGRGGLAKIGRELSWRKVRYAWRFAVAHLPSEANGLADSLSRTAAPGGSEWKPFPTELKGLPRKDPPLNNLWVC